MGFLKNVITDYNDYLKTHNSVETASKFGAIVEGEYYNISPEMFLNYLIDRIADTVIFGSRFDNPLSKLYNGDMTYGAIIQDIRTIRGVRGQDYNSKDFNPDVTNPYEKNKPVLSEAFHKVNFRKYLKTTVTHDQLLSAFTSDGAMQGLISLIVSDLGMQRYALEYSEMKDTLIGGIAKKVYFKKDDFSSFYNVFKDVMTNFKDYDASIYYNKVLNPEPAQVSDLYLIMSETFKNKADVNFFATLFNVDYAEIKDQIIYIKDFPDNSVKAMVVDKRAVFFKKVLDRRTELINGADLTKNIWEHFWRLYSISPHFGVVAICEETEGVNKPTVSIDSGVYEGQQTVIITQGTATNVKYILNNGEETDVTTTAQVTIPKKTPLSYVSVLTVKYDGGEDVYRYRIY